MMNEKMIYTGTFGEALSRPQSKVAKAFFDGARAMMTAIESMPPDAYRQALSAKNWQHIIALLVESEERQHSRRLRDMESFLKPYQIDKEAARGFIFNVPAVDYYSGRAMDGNGKYIEDENFQLMPGREALLWPNCKILNYEGEVITREQYLALGQEGRRYCTYERVLPIGTDNHHTATTLLSSDNYAMTVLIRLDIQTGDPGVVRRYRYALAHEDDPRFSELKKYELVILEACARLEKGSVVQGFVEHPEVIQAVAERWSATKKGE